MARKQTWFTEMLVGVVVVGHTVDNLTRRWNDIWSNKVRGVTPEMVRAFNEELAERQATPRGRRSISDLVSAGRKAREKLVAMAGNTTFSVRHVGGEKDGRFDAVTKDLEIPELNTRLSIKEGSDILLNSDIYRLISILSGTGEPAGERHGNAFRSMAEAEHDRLVEVCGWQGTVDALYALPKDQRKAFGHRQQVGRKWRSHAREQAYRNMTTAMKREAKNALETAIRHARAQRAFNDRILHGLFRMNGVKYMMVGTDKGQPFALWIPATKTWERTWELENITVQENAPSLQTEVFLDIHVRNRRTQQQRSFRLLIEIRWSHGPFCGNPEAKLKKVWMYSDLPWVE